jgi:hypothetical protein
VSAATVLLGLEDDQENWSIVNNGVEYKGTWASSTRYKKQDIVKSGPNLWIATDGHQSTSTFDDVNFDLWMPGLDFVNTWSLTTTYQPGDTVVYGGYTYISSSVNNINNVPSIDAVDWTLFTKGYELKSAWSNVTNYKIGSVVTIGGRSFVAIADSLNQNPGEIKAKSVIVSGGINNFLDGYYFLKSIPHKTLYAHASLFLKYAMQGEQELLAFVESQVQGLEMAQTYLTLKK